MKTYKIAKRYLPEDTSYNESFFKTQNGKEIERMRNS